MMRNRLRIFSLVVGAVALATLAAPAFSYEKVFEATYPLPSGGSFSLTNVNGSVHVQGWERNEVSIHAVKRSKTSPADEAQVKIEVEAQAGSVSVHTRYPEAEPVDVTVEYTVRVPARLLLARIQTVNGDVQVRDLEAGGELHTVNGDVEMLNGAGHVSAGTTNGNIRLELAHVGDRRDAMRVETVNGSVMLELAASVGADLEVQSLNGDFQSDLPLEVQAVAGRGEVRARLGRGGVPVVLRTVNGGIRILAARAAV